MEWDQLLPEDRRQLSALLNLDSNGMPHSAPNSVITPASHVPTTTTLTEIKKGIVDEVSKAAKHWTSIRDLRRYCDENNRRVPRLVSCVVKEVLSILNGACFTDFVIVCCRCELTYSAPRRLTSKRSRDSEASNSSLPVPTLSPFPDDGDTTCVTFDTMHFVHRFKPSTGFEVQSVMAVPHNYLTIQCVANDILRFGLLMYLRLQAEDVFTQQKHAEHPALASAASFADALDKDCIVAMLRVPTPATHPSGTKQKGGGVAILGMGGNVMGMCLHRLLAPEVPLHIVEIEPSVVASCTLHGVVPTPSERQDFFCHVTDAASAFERSDAMIDGSMELIILDCFDPIAEDMVHCVALLQAVKKKLRPCASTSGRAGGGVLVVNMHKGPGSFEHLRPFVEVFGGSGEVEAINMFGATQSVVVCCLRPMERLGAAEMRRFAVAVENNRHSIWEGRGDDFHIIDMTKKPSSTFRGFVTSGRRIVEREDKQKAPIAVEVTQQVDRRFAFVWSSADDTK